MYFDFALSSRTHEFSQFHDMHWENPGIAMRVRNSKTDVDMAVFGLTLSTVPRCLVIDPILIQPEYQRSLVLYRVIRKLESICTDIKVPMFIYMVRRGHTLDKDFAEALNCEFYTEDIQGFWVKGTLPLKWRKR